jgi:predicted nucleic acid-binding protein
MRLFLDANVLFTAAHNPRGRAALVIELGAAGYWQVFTSRFAIEEARRNLERKCPECLETLKSLRTSLELAEHQPGLRFPAGLPAKDRPIFQAALACGATHLLTGDRKDFGPLFDKPGETYNIRIQTVAGFFDSLLRS